MVNGSGNHEDAEMNRRDAQMGGGFAKEARGTVARAIALSIAALCAACANQVQQKYGGKFFHLFQDVFCSLPLATVRLHP